MPHSLSRLVSEMPYLRGAGAEFKLKGGLKMKHTSGTWKQVIRQPGTMLTIENNDCEYVCSLLGGDKDKEANARLIAAAPDLLEACKAAAKFYQDNFDIMPVAWQTFDDILTQAIEKAEGKE
jgi:hypothetical protein